MTDSIGRKWVLITGSSTGIGRACALYLKAQGFDVLAGVRKESDGLALEQAANGVAGARGASGSLKSILLDVTRSESIKAAMDQIEQLTGADGLQGLVNNAGVAGLGPIEFAPIDHWRQVFEVNVIGLVACTQAVLPLLRRHVARAGAGTGRVVHICSIAGRIAQPMVGPYCASKHAVEAIGDTMRLELGGQGIQTSLIEPGAIQSEIWRKGDEIAATATIDPRMRELYGGQIDAVIRTARQSAANAPPAELVARAVHRCLSARRAPTRILVGRDARIAAVLRRFLPMRMFDWFLLRAFGIPAR